MITLKEEAMEDLIRASNPYEKEVDVKMIVAHLTRSEIVDLLSTFVSFTRGYRTEQSKSLAKLIDAANGILFDTKRGKNK